MSKWVSGGTSTLSKSGELFPENAPKRLERALGSRVWEEGTSRGLVDWVSGLLSISLGHCHPEIVTAVTDHLAYDGGPTWSLPHALEGEVAETVSRLCGLGENGSVRWFKTGSEACSAAIRIARAQQIRECQGVVSIGYHGWHDGLLATPPAWGVPQPNPFLTVAPFNDLDAVKRLVYSDAQVGVVIVEPETTERPKPSYLQELKKLCDRENINLVFDECISGGRHSEFTAGRHYGVEPDLTILSKGLANGFPLAAVVGSRDLMACFDVGWRPEWDLQETGPTGPVYCSGTWSGETVGLAAAKATLAIWERDKVAARNWQLGTDLLWGLREVLGGSVAQERVSIRGLPYRIILDCPDLKDKTAVMSHLLKRGHLIGAGWNITAAHTEEDVADVINAFAESLTVLDEPCGRSVVAPYRQQ